MSPFRDRKFETLERAVREAGAFLMSKWPGGPTKDPNLTITQKADGSLVSAADMGSNEILMSALSSLFPNDFILSEEIESDPSEVRAASRVWIVDPLDGTSAFLEGRDDFSILVGLSVDRVALAGLMYFPARNIMYLAHQGAGVVRNGARIAVSASQELRSGKVYARHCSLINKELESPFMDSGLAFAQVATGELDGAVVRMKTHREWDLAAPMSVLIEAGAKVSDEKGMPIEIGVGEVSFEYFVVSNDLCHEALLGLIVR